MSFSIRNLIYNLISGAQVSVLWFYLFKNIEAIGDFGVELPILGFFIAIGFLQIFVKYFNNGFRLKINLVIFLILNVWVAIRYLIDFQDINLLKGVLVATTGGMFLFFIIGLLSNEALKDGGNYRGINFIILGSIYTGLCMWLFEQFFGRLRGDLFLLDDSSGDYQRPGNFISISFIIFSYIYIKSSAANYSFKKNKLLNMISIVIYICASFVLIFVSQIIGSNSATAIVAMISILTLIISMISSTNRFQKNYKINGGNVFRIKSLVLNYYKSLISPILLLVILIFGVSFLMDFDITQTRIFGFGEMENSSINTRFEIFSKWGIHQMFYSPFFGDANVAYLVTGNSGTTLHNFMPNVLATLGVVGLSIVLMLFAFVFRALYRESIRNNNKSIEKSFSDNLISFYSLIIIIFIFLFANLTVGFSWPVIWFSVGFLIPSISGLKKI